MAGFFSGLGAGLGGAGQAAGQYGQQVRAHLEKRRGDFADLIGKAAETELDPQTRAALQKHQADLAAGKPIGKIGTDFQKTLEKRVQDEQALHGLIGKPAQPPAPQPGPAQPGQVPGTLGAAPVQPDAGFTLPGIQGIGSAPPLQAEPAPPVAAQPASNPIAGAQGPIHALPEPSPAPITAIAPAAAAPTNGLRSVQDIYQQFAAMPEFGTPAGRQALAPFISNEISHNEALRNEQALRTMDLDERKGALAELQKSPEWKTIPDIMKSQYTLWAHSRTAPVPAMSSGLMRPVNFGGTMPAGSINPAELVDINGNPIDISKSPFVRQHLDLLGGRTYYSPATGPMQAVAGGNGLEFVPRTPGTPTGAGGGAVQPISALTPRATGVDANGHQTFETFQGMKKGDAPISGSGTAPSLLGTERSTSTQQLPGGGSVSSVTSRKVLPAPGAPVKTGQTPIPAAPGAPAIPHTGDLAPSTAVRPIDPKNDVDNKALSIARDANNWKMVNNVADKAQVTKRMAELGLQPGMITSNMRERAKNARLILGHLDDVMGIIKKADKDGDLGVVATRWNDFLTNKLGKDPTKTQVFARLSSNLGFLSTAVSMAHGGLRGGSSPTMVEHWEKALDAKDPATLRAKLGEAMKWMQGYSTMDNGLADQAPGTITPPGAATASAVNDLINKYK